MILENETISVEYLLKKLFSSIALSSPALYTVIDVLELFPIILVASISITFLPTDKSTTCENVPFLSTGDSMDPIDELKVAGVDMLDEKVINGAIDMFQELINEYRSLM